MSKGRKKWVVVALVACLTVVGCGGKPRDVSDEMYESAVYDIKAVDLYLNAESELEDTYEKLSKNLMEYEEVGDEYEGDSYAWTLTLNLETDILGMKAGTQDVSGLKNDRNELAKKINCKE